MNPIATLFEVKIQYDWQKEYDDVSIYTAGSLEGARQIVEEEGNRKDNNILWYSIYEHKYYPCDDSNPMGRLYIGIGYHELWIAEENK